MCPKSFLTHYGSAETHTVLVNLPSLQAGKLRPREGKGLLGSGAIFTLCDCPSSLGSMEEGSLAGEGRRPLGSWCDAGPSPDPSTHQPPAPKEQAIPGHTVTERKEAVAGASRARVRMLPATHCTRSNHRRRINGSNPFNAPLT